MAGCLSMEKGKWQAFIDQQVFYASEKLCKNFQIKNLDRFICNCSPWPEWDEV